MSEDNGNGVPPIHSEGWKQWSQNVTDTLKKMERKIDKLEERITDHREDSLVDVATLKAKAGIVGTVAGLVASFIMSVLVGLFVYQLTVGSHTKSVPPDHKHIVDTNVSYILPPREDQHNELLDMLKGVDG